MVDSIYQDLSEVIGILSRMGAYFMDQEVLCELISEVNFRVFNQVGNHFNFRSTQES